MKVQRYEVISKWTNLEISKFGNEVRAALAGGISKFGNEKISKCGGLGSSEGNGEERKGAERNFGEKML